MQQGLWKSLGGRTGILLVFIRSFSLFLYLCTALSSYRLATLLLLSFLAVKDLSASLLLWQIMSIPCISHPLLKLLPLPSSLFTRRGYTLIKCPPLDHQTQPGQCGHSTNKAAGSLAL